jgi:signal transduction histidine kinase
MRERAEKIGGTFLATSSPGQGTIISVRISVPEQVSDSSIPGSYLAKQKGE